MKQLLFSTPVVILAFIGRGVLAAFFPAKAFDVLPPGYTPTAQLDLPSELRGMQLSSFQRVLKTLKRIIDDHKNANRPLMRPKFGGEEGEREEITIDNATLYDVNTIIIKPTTRRKEKPQSFAEMVHWSNFTGTCAVHVTVSPSSSHAQSMSRHVRFLDSHVGSAECLPPHAHAQCLLPHAES